jgi:CBS domain-containing protein
MKTLSAEDIMSTDLLTVGPDMTVRELASFLSDNQITGAPVVDDHGRLLGMASLSDIAQSDAEEGELVPEAGAHGWEDEATADEMAHLHVAGSERTVRDIMTPTTYAVRHDTPVSRVAMTMIAGRVHRLLVTREHKVVGIVTSLDLLKLLTHDHAPAPPPRPRSRGAGPRQPRV